MLRNITVTYRKILSLRRNRTLAYFFVTQLNVNSVFINLKDSTGKIPQYQIGKTRRLLPIEFNELVPTPPLEIEANR